jgi:cytoskeletal protein CcmA (bactofilin family)
MRTHRRTVAGAISLAAALLGSLAFGADPQDPPKIKPPSEHGRPFHVAAGETHVGDVYRFTSTVDIAGTQKGDLTVWAQSVTIPGTVTGDLYAAAQNVDISGTVGDSARIAASTVFIRGTIDGDLSIWGANVTIAREAHVTGDVHCFSARCEALGQVDGDLQATGGQVTLGGKVAGSATIRCDVLEVAPDTRIAGDLDYEAREKLALDGTDIVAGSVTYEPKKEKEKDHDDGVSGWKLFVWFWLLVAAVIVGFLGLWLFEGPTRAVTAAVRTDMLRSSGVGFLAVIVVPVAGALACILIITIPLVLILWFLYCLALYFAQFPVAGWLGGRILGLFGKREPSRYLALFVGLLVLYLLFAIPCVGWLVMFYAVFLGFGAILLGLRTWWLQRKAASPPGGPVQASEPAPVTT